MWGVSGWPGHDKIARAEEKGPRKEWGFGLMFTSFGAPCLTRATRLTVRAPQLERKLWTGAIKEEAGSRVDAASP